MTPKSSHFDLVEIVGTFFLVYAILSAASVYSKSGQLGVIGIGLVHAFALTAIVYALGYKSGAQVNPAVTIGLLVSGKLTLKEAGLYIVSQFIGAIIASAVVFAMFGQSMAAGVTLPSDGNVIRALLLETVMTFTLVYVVLSTTTAKNKIAPMMFEPMYGLGPVGFEPTTASAPGLYLAYCKMVS